MKKILFVIDTLRMGGAEKSLVSLLNAIDKEKYDIDVLVFEEGGILQKELPENIRLIHADSKTRAMTLEFRKYSRDLLKKGALGAYIARIRMTLNAKKGKKSFNWNLIKKHIPVFEGSYDAAISYLEGFPAFYVIDKVKAEKKIAWIHIDTTKYNMSSDERKYYAKFDQIVTISEICKSAFIDHVPEIAEKINVIENIVDPQEVLAKADEQVDYSTWRENAVNLVTVGRLDYQKGLDMAIEACGQLVKYGVDVIWHEYGTGILKDELQKQIDELGLNGRFILEGVVVNPYPYMKNADMIIQSSRYEGKSIVLDEAKILGKTIVTTNYESVYDQIVPDETGIITEMSPSGIAQGITLLLNNSELKERIERGAKQSAVNSSDILAKLDQLLN